MNSNPQQQKMLDYPVWRLNFREYGELKGYDLSQTESACQWYDDRGSFEDRVAANLERFDPVEAQLIKEARINYGDWCVSCGKDAYTCEHYEEPNHERI